MEIQKVNFLANIIVINSVGIDVILGMDCLSKNQGKIDCAQRSISATSENGNQVVFAPFMRDSQLYALEACTSLELEKVTPLNFHFYVPADLNGLENRSR